MKKAIIIIICAIFIASIAIVNFFGLEVAIFQGFTYVNDIEITSLTVINGGDMYEIEPYKNDETNGVKTIYFRFKFVDEKTEDGVNPNMIKIDYAVRPDNADNKNIDFVYDEEAYENTIVFYKDLQTVEFLKANKSIEITLSTTDGHNVKKRIKILSLDEEKFDKINKWYNGF